MDIKLLQGSVNWTDISKKVDEVAAAVNELDPEMTREKVEMLINSRLNAALQDAVEMTLPGVLKAAVDQALPAALQKAIAEAQANGNPKA